MWSIEGDVGGEVGLDDLAGDRLGHRPGGWLDDQAF
jgi:hypothetical protein